MTTPNTPTPKPLSDAVLARASELHDAAFADPECTRKPSWAESVAAAQAEGFAAKPSDQPPAENA